jgi:hypothetical protein
MDIETMVKLSERSRSKCEQLQRTYRGMKDILDELRSIYEDVQQLAHRASQSNYRDQVSQEIQEVGELAPEARIPEFLARYRDSGGAAGQSGVSGYRAKLDRLADTFQNFLAQQDRLGRLNELRSSAKDLVSQIDKLLRSLDDLEISVEGIESLTPIPLFFQLELEMVRKEVQVLLNTSKNALDRFKVDTTETEPLQTQLEDLQNSLTIFAEHRDTFKDRIRQTNYRLRAMFSPMSFHCLEETHTKLLEDFRVQFRKEMQQVFRAESYSDAEARYGRITEHIEQAENCLQGISDLDAWFERLTSSFEPSKFGDTSVDARAGKAAKQIDGSTIDQVYRMLDRATAERKRGDYSRSLKTTRQVVDTVISHIEQVQGSESARLQVTLLSQSSIGFPELMIAYEQRFGEPFDDRAGAELIRLLKEGKLHATFSI